MNGLRTIDLFYQNVFFCAASTYVFSKKLLNAIVVFNILTQMITVDNNTYYVQNTINEFFFRFWKINASWNSESHNSFDAIVLIFEHISVRKQKNKFIDKIK